MSRRKINLLLAAMIAMNGIAVLYAAAIFRPLVGEGASWMFMGTASHAFEFDAALTRYFHIVWQIPGIALDRAGFSWLTVLSTHMYMHSISGMISLAVSYWILKRKRQTELFTFPLLAFALVSMILTVQPFDLVVDVVALAWPLALLSLLGPRGKYEWSAMFFFNFALMFSHETSIGILLTLAVLKCTEIIWVRSRSGTSFTFQMVIPELVQVGLFSIGILWLAYRIWGPTAGENAYFFSQMKSVWVVSSIAAAVLTPIFCTALLAPAHFVVRWKRTFILLTCAVLAIAFNFFLDSEQWKFIIGARTARAFAIPLTALWITVMFLYLRFRVSAEGAFSEREQETERMNVVRVLVAIFLVLTFCTDVEGSRNWKVGFDNLANAVRTPGCYEVTASKANKTFAQYGLFPRELPVLSAMISQIEFGEVRTIVGTFAARAHPGEPVCCTVQLENIPVYNRRFQIPDRRSFDITKIANDVRESGSFACPGI